MYLRHFNFRAKPFAMNPDPTFLYPSEQHSKAFTMLEYAMESQAAFCVLTGEIGSGKTTLVRHLIRSLGDRVAVGLVSNTHENFSSIHPWALSALGIVARDGSETAQYEALTEFFIREYGKGRRTLLIFDESQNLSVQALEELRLLSNLNSEGDIALQILLVGQPELRSKMAQPELRQFSQRVAVDFHLQCLSQAETEAYIHHRLCVAGGNVALFQPGAIAYIHKLSGGIPRLVNRLCDLSLVYAFADAREHVDSALVAQVLQDRSSGRAINRSGRETDVGPAAVAPIDPAAPAATDELLHEHA
jgi:type II secretory pathway predicted ATPase ExeA